MDNATSSSSTNGEVRMREKKPTARTNNTLIGNHDKKTLAFRDSMIDDGTISDPKATFEQLFLCGLTIEEALKSNENLLELTYNACKYNHLEVVKRCIEEKKVNINEPFNNDYSLCIASHKGHLDIVRYLLAHGANVHVKRELSVLSTRGNHRLSRINLTYGDSPLSLAVKYGFDEVALALIDHGAAILSENNDFEKSALQDSIRLNRIHIFEVFLKKLKDSKNSSTCVGNLLSEKKFDILRQCLINDQINALNILIPHIWKEFNSDLMFIVLNNLMLKNKIQTEKAFDVLESILELIPTGKMNMPDIGDLIRRFFNTLQAQFLTISDDRIQILHLRTSLLFTILKYHETIDFTNYLESLDVFFLAIHNSVESAGEGINQIYDYMVRFYEDLILMGHLDLSNGSVILKLLECEHVQRMESIDMYLSWRARNPFLLKERCRLYLKNRLVSYKQTTLEKLNLDEDTYSYLTYQR